MQEKEKNASNEKKVGSENGPRIRFEEKNVGDEFGAHSKQKMLLLLVMLYFDLLIGLLKPMQMTQYL